MMMPKIHFTRIVSQGRGIYEKKALLILAGGALLMAAIPALYMNSIFGYLPVLMLILSAPASLLYRELLRRNIYCLEQNAAGICQRGESRQFTVKIQNRSWLICSRAQALFFRSDLFGGTDSVTVVPLALAPFETREFGFTIPFAHVGRYKVGLQELRVFGLFGVSSVAIPAAGSHLVDVVPQSCDMSSLVVSKLVHSESERAMIRSAAEEMDYAGVREYAFGDPIKTIHWKLSAHAAGYLTKQMESYGTNGISILMDLQLPGYSTELQMNALDCIAEAGASLCRYAKGNGLDYELLYFDRFSEKRRYIPVNTTDFAQLWGDVTVMKPGTDGNTSMLRLLREELMSLYGPTNIAVCTANVTRELLQTLIEAKIRKRHTVLLYALPALMDDRLRADKRKSLRVLEGAGVPYYILASHEELRKVAG